MLGKFPLIKREEAACGRDAVAAGSDQLVRRLNERLQEIGRSQRRDLVRARALDDAVLNRERPSAGVADDERLSREFEPTGVAAVTASERA